MLRIRPEQFETFRQYGVARFQAQLCRAMRAELPGWTHTLTPEALQQRVESAIARALQHRFVLREHITAYVRLALRYGESLDDQPWAVAIFRDPSLSAAHKLTALQRAAAGNEAP